MRRGLLLLTLGCVSLGLHSCGGDSNPSATATPAATAVPTVPAGETMVDATADNRWDPETLNIAVGENVTFRWTGPVPHNVRIDGLIDTPVTATGQHRVTFEAPGTYSYICDVHLATMVGTVTVE